MDTGISQPPRGPRSDRRKDVLDRAALSCPNTRLPEGYTMAKAKKAKKPAAKKAARKPVRKAAPARKASAPRKAAGPNWKQKGAQDVIVQLVLRDAGGAIEFYKKALGAQEMVRHVAPDGKS